LFKTLPAADDTRRDTETNAAVPSEENVVQAKKWADEHEL
jgi:hypothetical protein